MNFALLFDQPNQMLMQVVEGNTLPDVPFHGHVPAADGRASWSVNISFKR